MRHQDRQGRICQDVPGGSAENHLSQPALGIGALDQQVTLQRRCVRQDGLAGAAILGLDSDGFAQHAVAMKIAGELFAGRPRHGSTLHCQHDDMTCFLEKRHCTAVVLACSVLPFHAIRIFSPMRCGRVGGAIKTGRPDSNKPASIVVMLGLDRLLALRRIRAIVQGI